MNGLHDNWEDWLPQIAASINCSVNDSTGKSPYFKMFGVEKRFPYDLLTSCSQPVYNIDTYAKQQIQVFSQIHPEVRISLKATKEEMTSKQNKRAVSVSLKQGDTVFIRQSERSSKLAPKFFGPYIIVRHITGNKFELLDPKTNISMEVHSDLLKKVTSNTKPCSPSDSEQPSPVSHTYNLRPRH